MREFSFFSSFFRNQLTLTFWRALIDISAALQIAAQSLLPAFLRREFRDAKKRADTSIELFVAALVVSSQDLTPQLSQAGLMNL